MSMLVVSGVGRVTTPFELRQNVNRENGEKFFACDIPVATDVGSTGNKTTFIVISLTGARAKAAAENLLIGQQLIFSGDLLVQDYTHRESGEARRAVKVGRMHTFSYGASPRDRHDPACEAWYIERPKGSTVVTPEDIEAAEVPVEERSDVAEEASGAEVFDLEPDAFIKDELDGEEGDSEDAAPY
jgi:single-stranded DNA-binding protein